MPKIEILESVLGRAVIAETDGRLLDACDDARAPIAFSCRSANCGTCRLEVIAGAELLLPADDDERETLARLGLPQGQRLGCQVIVRRARGLVRLRWAGE